MYAFVNDLSLQKPTDSDDKAVSLLTELIEVFSTLKQYKIEKLRVPEAFKTEFIFFGRKPLKGIIEGLAGEKYATQRNYILTIFNLISEIRPPEHARQIDEQEIERICEVSYLEAPSIMLTQAHILQLPVVSVLSGIEFECDFIDCVTLTVSANGNRPGVTRLKNRYSSQNAEIHHNYLISLQHGIEFANKRWNPYDNPSWRTDVTKEILNAASYPHEREQAGSGEARRINMKAATAVLEANGWDFNRNITRYNRSKPAVWRVYTNDFTNEDVYISVDLDEGEFEICNRHGEWQVTRFFDGRPTGKNYGNSTSHNIRIKNSK